MTAWLKEIELYPQSAGTYNNIGLYYLKKNDLKQGGFFFRQGLKYNPDAYLAYYGLGKIAEIKKDHARAEILYQKALSLKDDDARIYHALGKLYAKNKDPQSINYLFKALALNPHYLHAYNDLAVALVSLTPPNWKLADKFAQKAKQAGYPVKEGLLKLIATHNR